MKLFVAMPCYGGMVSAPTMVSLFDSYTMLGQKGLVEEFCLQTLQKESLISRGRNMLAQWAVDRGYTHLLFIDADLTFTPRDFELLLQAGKDKDIVGGTYTWKTFPLVVNFNAEGYGKDRGQDGYFEYIKKYAQPDGLAEVRHIPTGFMLVKTSVFKDLAQRGLATPYSSYNHEDHSTSYFYDYFPVRVYDGRYQSEDWAFCEIARAAGFKVWLQTQIVCGHMGSHIYQLGQHAAIGQKPLIPAGERV